MSVPFWARIASIVPLTSIVRTKGTEPTDPRRRLQYFSRRQSGARCDHERELLLLGARDGGVGRGEGMAQRAQNPEAAFDSVGPDGVWNNEQIAARITGFVSFHGVILKQGVGHRLSDAKK